MSDVLYSDIYNRAPVSLSILISASYSKNTKSSIGALQVLSPISCTDFGVILSTNVSLLQALRPQNSPPDALELSPGSMDPGNPAKVAYGPQLANIRPRAGGLG